MNNTIKTALVSLLLAATITPVAHAQKKAAPAKKTTTATPAKKTTAVGSKAEGGFKKLASGLEYKIVKHGTGTRKPVVKDHIEIYIHVHVADSVLFDSRKMYGVKPVPYPIAPAKFKGDPVEGFMMMVVGDSAVFRLPVDSMQKAGNQLLPWMKLGQKIEYDVVLTSVKSDAEEKRDNEIKSAAQKGIDDKLLQDYFKKNNVKPTKTASGLYYTVSNEGEGEQIKAGQTVVVNYRGVLIDGKPFDTNMDSSFHHMEPFTLEIGKGRVIKGWDEGIMLLKKGAKAKLYIPSGLAYGAQDRGPIPANAILIFDIDILDVKSAEQLKKDAEEKASKAKLTEDKDIKDYLAKNNLHATRTESGMYYTITKEGTGENAKPGQKISMSYLGKLLNGKVFDKNVDDNFVCTRPFTFVLGQHQVIEGWDEGVQLLKKGSRATFYLPSWVAYGERGAGAGIPPNAILIFDVELTNIEQ